MRTSFIIIRGHWRWCSALVRHKQAWRARASLMLNIGDVPSTLDRAWPRKPENGQWFIGCGKNRLPGMEIKVAPNPGPNA